MRGLNTLSSDQVPSFPMGCFVSGCDLGSILQVHFDLELNHVGVVVGGMDFAGVDCETEWF